ncbi:MAG: TonB-dependent receptor [Bernardetiaceae bacterium]|nr:TonB-dependent receptor [Bernardetiaceae bacterium]
MKRHLPPRLAILLAGLIWLGLVTQPAQGQDTLTAKILKAQARDLLQIDTLREDIVAIAGIREQTLEEAPSIVSVITQADISAYGYRDLADALRAVAGFELGLDVSQIIGVGFRGIWAHEGKMLVMLNGMMLNDLAYGNMNLIGTLPLHMVDRIEIIRGPGSALYGGLSGVATLNIITRRGSQLNGIELNGNLGQVGQGGFARYGNLSAGTRYKDFNLAVHAGVGARPLTTRPYRDFFGNEMAMTEFTALRSYDYVVADVSYKKLDLRYQRTVTRYFGNDGYDTLLPLGQNGINPEAFTHHSTGVMARYRAKLGSRWTIEPIAEITHGNSISTSLLPASAIAGLYNFLGSYDLQRLRGEILATHSFKTGQDVTLGTGYIRDVANMASSRANPGLYGSLSPDDTVRHKYTDDRFVYFQYAARWGQWGVTAGIRYDNTSFGNAYAPRLGLTYTGQRTNVKLLYGRSFRIPQPFQAYARDLGDPRYLFPEATDTYELETGYRWPKRWTVKANWFYTIIRQPIVYVGNLNTYTNDGTYYTFGFEAEAKASFKNLEVFSNLSHARTQPGTVGYYANQNKTYALALPPWKLNLGIKWQRPKFDLAPQFTWLSARYGQSEAYAQGIFGEGDNTLYSAAPMLNCNFSYRLGQRVKLNLSAYNIFNHQFVLIQAYYGNHAPMPAMDRQFNLGLTVKL